LRRLVTTFIAFACLAVPAAAMADATVDITDPGYNPSTTTITVGQSVTWNYQSITPHGVKLDGGATLCDPHSSAELPAPAPCTQPFNTAGRYQYYDPQCPDYASCTGFQGLVVVDGPPVAAATGPASAQRGQTVTFDGSGSDPDGDAITGYHWDFGDGTTGDGPQVQHAFTTAGHYDVTLTVSDSTGSGSTTIGIDITVPDSDGDGINDDLDKCPTTPASTSDGCPFVPPPIPPRIVSSATVASVLGQSAALKSGVTAVLNCSGFCTGSFVLLRNGKPVSVPVTTTLTSSGSKLVTIKFTSAARRALAKAKKPKLILQVLVTDAISRVQTRKDGVTLEAVKTWGRLPAIGISDNQPTTFTDPNFQILKLKYGRLVTPWNSIFSEPARLAAWLQTARSHGIRPLVSFEHTRGQLCPSRKCKAPSKAQYTRAWKAFHKKYSWVKDISPWNEVNSATQPTGTHPETAATFYNVVRANCRGCSIVAADLLDASNIRRYAAAFIAKAKGNPRLWGLHNYTDTNRFRSRGTTALLQTVRGTVWLTETGGVVKFVTQSGKVALPKSESRAKKAMDYMFRLAEQNASRIKRIYVYQWKVNNVFDRFDAGLVRPDGTPRPSFQVLTLNASAARKR
jgi:PKD repeat protein